MAYIERDRIATGFRLHDQRGGIKLESQPEEPKATPSIDNLDRHRHQDRGSKKQMPLLSEYQLKAELAEAKSALLIQAEVTAREYREKIELQLLNEKLKGELKSTTSKAKNPVIWTFDTSEVRAWDRPNQKTSKVITFSQPYSVPPLIALGLTSLDIENRASVGVYSYVDVLRNDICRINIATFADVVAYSAGCVGLEVKSDDLNFQCGNLSTARDRRWHVPQIKDTYLINFSHPYSETPFVVVWLKGFNLCLDNNRCLSTYATDITTEGFTLNIETWNDSVLYGADISWIALPADKAGVFSGSFGTSHLRSGGRSELGYVNFNSDFHVPPRVAMAVNRIDMGWRDDTRFALKVSNVTATGMTWQLDGDDGLYSVGASFIALR